MFCTNCGASIADDSAFCTNCGQSFQSASAAMQPQPSPVPAPVPKKKRTGLIAGIIAAAVVVLALVAGAALMFAGGNEPETVYLKVLGIDSGGFPDEALVFLAVSDKDGEGVEDLSRSDLVLSESKDEGPSTAADVVSVKLVDANELPSGTDASSGAALYIVTFVPAFDGLEAHDLLIETADGSNYAGTTATRYTPNPGAGENNEPSEETSAGTLAFHGVTTVRASSVRTGEYGNSYEASNVLSYSGSAWCEGVAGSGTGEWLEFEGDGRQTFSGFTINAGYESSHGSSLWDHYSYNNRPKSITVYADGVKAGSFALDDAAVLARDTGDPMQTVTFASPVTATTVRVVIDSVYAGSCPDDDTCISLVIFF